MPESDSAAQKLKARIDELRAQRDRLGRLGKNKAERDELNTRIAVLVEKLKQLTGEGS